MGGLLEAVAGATGQLLLLLLLKAQGSCQVSSGSLCS
jgi:hypothetical protein